MKNWNVNPVAFVAICFVALFLLLDARRATNAVAQSGSEPSSTASPMILYNSYLYVNRGNKIYVYAYEHRPTKETPSGNIAKLYLKQVVEIGK